MKNLYLILLTVLLSAKTFGQTTILTSALEPVVGDTVFYTNITSAFDSGAVGENVTWDFSGVSHDASASPQVTQDPSVASDIDSFPGTNQVYGNFFGHEFLKQSANKKEVLGYDLTDIIYYSNSEEIAHYPFTYGDFYGDPFLAEVNSMDNGHYYRIGSVNVTADGYGTLKTPAGTFTDVLRVRTIETYSDTFPDFPAYTIHYRANLYNWYKTGIKGSLLSHTQLIRTADNNSEVVFAYNSTPGIATGINESPDNSNVLIYPNPAQNRFTVLNTRQFEKYELVDISGRLVIEGTTANRDMLQVNTSSLASGFYFIKLSMANGERVTRKIEINN